MAKRTLFRSLLLLLLALAAWLVPAVAEAQIFVRPRRAFKSEVHYFEFDWRHLDMLDRPEQGGGGVRFYFYEREREVAERAASFLGDGYEYLYSRFGYYPSRRFPYILYNTYQEFLETNLFPISEGVLGVTSTQQDLTLTLPYLGDHRRFREISTHELAHQFTIQKVRDFAREAEVDNPLELLPLWFVEGLAEYYAHRGLDPETEMLARDLMTSPDVEKGYIFLDFFEERMGSFLWTYKLGQARCAFLEETYGDGTIQQLLEAAPRLFSDKNDAIIEQPDDPTPFAALLRTITGENPRMLAARFDEWLKRRSFRTFLEAGQGAMEIEVLETNGHNQFLTSMAASPAGDLLLVRRIDPDTGQSGLWLMDPRLPDSAVRVAQDGVPGVESLHPVSDRNFDVGSGTLVFVSQLASADVLYRQAFTHKAVKLPYLDQRPVRPSWERRAPLPELWDIELTLGDRERYDLSPFGLIAAESPALSPDGQRIAFIGIDNEGVRDIYVVSGPASAPKLVRYTEDLWAEREVSWGPRGIVYSSDATEHHKYNLFLLPHDDGDPERLTTEERDHFDPRALPDGRIVFVAYDNARANVHEVTPDGVARRTDIATGLFDLAPGTGGGLWALLFQKGEYRPAHIRPKALQLFARRNGVMPQPAPVLGMRSLDGAQEYDAFASENWQLGNIFGVLGASGDQIVGQVMATASDRLRNHVLVLDVAVLGELELTDGSLLYINQENRLEYGGGFFQSLLFRNDHTFDDRDLPFRFTSVERFYGAVGVVRYPLNTFQYVEADLAVGGVRSFLDEVTRTFLEDPELNDTGNLVPEWEEAHDETFMQGQASLRLGHDTIRYHRQTGPLAGSSVLLEGSVTSRPEIEEVFGDVRLDAERYFALGGAANFFARLGAGTTLGGELAPEFYLSSFDTLRGVSFGDLDFLLGRHFYYTTVELQLPLNRIIRVVFLPNIEGIAGFDFGAVGEDQDELMEKRVLDGVLGFNMIFGPLVLRLHFAKPIDTEADARKVGLDRAHPGRGWVTNFSLAWLYF